ncbi:pectin lyase-like protein [Leucosporidium creatinivorum]|uniref:galacturonan 1,4-alpha-galacturonidase n=1 Tax=Leucosporidium creatinivorum TaxID=106004 RepID=A0A1Y2FBL8_9BASI|nr:pectin lyase-like protein [Leucosporidium creatinivorum]
MRSLIALTLISALGAVAAPSKSKATVCTVEASHSAADDTPALLKVLNTTECLTDATILFKQGATYNIYKPVAFPALKNVVVSIQGNINLPSNVTLVQSIVSNSKIYPGYWFTFKSGSGITIEGNSKNKNQGWIDSHGQQWWDANNQVNRPHLMSISASNVVVSYLKIKKPVGWVFKAAGSNMNFNHITIDAKSDSSAFPFNTDGFDVGGVNVTLTDNYVVNGDDCITINNGAKNVYAADNYCEGGHGASLGSFGSGGSVAAASNITFTRFTMVDSLYGGRFKSWSGGNGLVSDVHYSDFTLRNVSFPIFITQNYYDQSVGKPANAGTNNTNIANFSYRNFAGTIDSRKPGDGSCVTNPCWYAVNGTDGTQAIIFDFAKGTDLSATNIVTSNINIRPDDGRQATVICDPEALQETDKQVGFVCHDGLYIRA